MLSCAADVLGVKLAIDSGCRKGFVGLKNELVGPSKVLQGFFCMDACCTRFAGLHKGLVRSC